MSSSSRLRQKNHGVGLPHDLILDIFVKLPVKSLVRFKYLSEQWFQLLTDPCFTDRHLSNQRKKFPRFVSRSSAYGDTMLNSCDGLLCLYEPSHSVTVINPATVESDVCVLVCMHSSQSNALINLITGFNFAGSRRCHAHDRLAIGRDPVTKRYKIVRVFNPDVSKTGQVGHHDFCRVFILDPNWNCDWKTIGEVPYRIDVFSRSVYVDGAIYWFTNEINHLNNSEVIIMFDLHIEQFQAIPHPSSCSNKQRRSMQLGTLRECLCLAQLEVDPLVLNVWIMENQKQKITWEKLYCIQIPRNYINVRRRFAFAEHKDGTLLVCTADDVFFV
ncbi:hypothetical protein V6N13_090699 [Hibiscus sabdariffa]|uniref:F-box domain-containing protein n=1 Tax=Hibiscus sabdariffa TaxID=183260 RepID=A0ABR2BNK6_9ROSI